MASVNKVMLLGNMTREIEERTTQGGTRVGRFGLAMNRKTKNGETTCFIDCVAFDKAGEVIGDYTHKGSLLFVEGRLEFSSWETDDGQKRSKVEEIVEQFQLMPKSTQAPPSGGRERQPTGGATGASTDEDLPF